MKIGHSKCCLDLLSAIGTENSARNWRFARRVAQGIDEELWKAASPATVGRRAFGQRQPTVELDQRVVNGAAGRAFRSLARRQESGEPFDQSRMGI